MLERDKLTRAMDIVLQGTRDAIIPKLEPGQDIATILFLVDEDGSICNIVNMVMMQEVPPQVIEHAVKKVLEEFQPAGYIVQHMMWFLIVQDGQEMPDVRPSQHPDRGEAYVMAAGSATDSIMRSFAVTRTDGKITSLAEQNLEGGQTIGLFHDLMGSQTTRTIH